MTKISKKKIVNLDFYKIFKPELTPKKMLELGVFGGSYFGSKIKEFPPSWIANAKLSKTFDININRFKVKLLECNFFYHFNPKNAIGNYDFGNLNTRLLST